MPRDHMMGLAAYDDSPDFPRTSRRRMDEIRAQAFAALDPMTAPLEVVQFERKPFNNPDGSYTPTAAQLKKAQSESANLMRQLQAAAHQVAERTRQRNGQLSAEQRAQGAMGWKETPCAVPVGQNYQPDLTLGQLAHARAAEGIEALQAYHSEPVTIRLDAEAVMHMKGRRTGLAALAEHLGMPNGKSPLYEKLVASRQKGWQFRSPSGDQVHPSPEAFAAMARGEMRGMTYTDPGGPFPGEPAALV